MIRWQVRQGPSTLWLNEVLRIRRPQSKGLTDIKRRRQWQYALFVDAAMRCSDAQDPAEAARDSHRSYSTAHGFCSNIAGTSSIAKCTCRAFHVCQSATCLHAVEMWHELYMSCASNELNRTVHFSPHCHPCTAVGTTEESGKCHAPQVQWLTSAKQAVGTCTVMLTVAAQGDMHACSLNNSHDDMVELAPGTVFCNLHDWRLHAQLHDCEFAQGAYCNNQTRAMPQVAVKEGQHNCHRKYTSIHCLACCICRHSLQHF